MQMFPTSSVYCEAFLKKFITASSPLSLFLFFLKSGTLEISGISGCALQQVYMFWRPDCDVVECVW